MPNTRIVNRRYPARSGSPQALYRDSGGTFSREEGHEDQILVQAPIDPPHAVIPRAIRSPVSHWPTRGTTADDTKVFDKSFPDDSL